MNLQLENTLTLLQGPSSCGKTSLLFNHAVQELVSKRSKKVCFVCPKKLERVPATHLDLPEDPVQLKNLSFHYISNRQELREFIVEQLPTERPNLVLIDSLQHYFSDLPDIYQTIKILENSLNFLHQRCGVECKVVFATSNASLAGFNENCVRDLIPGRVLISPAVRSGRTCFSVQGLEFEIFEDKGGSRRIKLHSQ